MNFFLNRERIANVFLALSYAFFFFNNFVFLSKDFRVSVFILAVFNGLLLIISLLRRKPQRVSFAPLDVIVTFVGTYSVFFLVGIADATEILFLQGLGIAGLLISLAGVFFLNESFGLLPANRGIVQNGIYRIIRHPIYAGYFVSNSCFLLQNFSSRNLILFSCFAVCETLRLLREEKLLSQQPDYAHYMQTVRWRLIPYVW